MRLIKTLVNHLGGHIIFNGQEKLNLIEFVDLESMNGLGILLNSSKAFKFHKTHDWLFFFFGGNHYKRVTEV